MANPVGVNISSMPDAIKVEDSPIFTEVVSLVTAVLERANLIYLEAKDLLQQAVLAAQPGALPGGTSVTITSPVKPSDIVITDVNTDITVGTVTKPDKISLGVIDTNVVVGEPVKPDVIFVLPPVPSLPTMNAVPEPDFTFGFAEAVYTSELGDALYQACLNELRNGSTGLTASVESDIYSRESERDTLELQRTKDKIANIWAESGMSLPDGVLVSAINAVELDYQNKYGDKSRDVRIESFKRADDNAKFVKDLSMKYESILRDYMGKYWDRQLKAATDVLTYTEVIYDSLLKYQAIFIERYKAEVEGFKAIIEGQAAMADAEAKIYTAEVNYEIGKAEVDVKSIGAEVDVQKTQLAAGAYDVSVYEADTKYEVAVADIESKAIAMKLEKQRSDVSVYQAKTQMYGTEAQFDLGSAEIAIKTVMANIELLKVQVNAAVAAAGDISHVSATMAAGSISALNANTSIGITESVSDSTSRSFSKSVAVNISPIGGYELV
jgi:hypothetical protein